MSSACALLSPYEWNVKLSGAPDLCSAASGRWDSAIFRRWSGTAPDMDQPPLDHHYLVLHLGGTKRVTRRGSESIVADAQVGSITLVPAGTSYSWSTKGPIGFAHLYIRPAQVDQVITQQFDRDPRSVELVDQIASPLPLLAPC